MYVCAHSWLKIPSKKESITLLYILFSFCGYSVVFQPPIAQAYERFYKIQSKFAHVDQFHNCISQNCSQYSMQKLVKHSISNWPDQLAKLESMNYFFEVSKFILKTLKQRKHIQSLISFWYILPSLKIPKGPEEQILLKINWTMIVYKL